METRRNVKFQANNVVMIEGTIDTFFEYDHSWKGQRFYNFTLAVRRTSETIDYIPCSISEKIIGEIRDWKEIWDRRCGNDIKRLLYCLRCENIQTGKKSESTKCQRFLKTGQCCEVDGKFKR